MLSGISYLLAVFTLFSEQNYAEYNSCSRSCHDYYNQNKKPRETSLFCRLLPFSAACLTGICNCFSRQFSAPIPVVCLGHLLFSARTVVPMSCIIKFPYRCIKAMHMGFLCSRDCITADAAACSGGIREMLFNCSLLSTSDADTAMGGFRLLPVCVIGMGGRSDISADSAICITAALICVDGIFCLHCAAAAGIPVSKFICRPFLTVFMFMIPFAHEYITTGQTGLFPFLCGCRTGIMGFQFTSSTADTAGMPVSFSVFRPDRAVSMGDFPF